MHMAGGGLCDFFATAPAVELVSALETRARNGQVDEIAGEIDAPEREIRTLSSHLKLIAG